MKNRFEAVVNIAVLVMSVTVVYAVVQRFVVPTYFRGQSTSGYRAGDVLTGSLGELPLSPSRLSALLIVSNHCDYCTDSAPFYRTLLASHPHAPGGTFQTIILGGTGLEDAKAFATTNLLLADHILAMPKDAWARVSGTPTLLLVDSSGRVVGSWTGKLSSRGERQVVDAISTVLADTRPAP